MIRMFDYIYYRIAKQYHKHDGKFAITAITLVALIQFMLILDVYSTFVYVFVEEENRKVYFPSKTISIAIILTILVLNYIKYWKKYEVFAERWSDESEKQKEIRDVLVIASILVPIIYPIVLINFY